MKKINSYKAIIGTINIDMIGDGNIFDCKADGYIPGTSIRFIIEKDGTRHEFDMTKYIVTFSKERENFIPKDKPNEP